MSQRLLKSLEEIVPAEDFGFNVFLVEIDESLTEDDFVKLKYYCEGKHGIGKRYLEAMKRPIDLFRALRERDILSVDNLLTLQGMLWFLPRKDLQKKCAEFAKENGNGLHFVVPRETPENGYKYVKFHIKGKDIGSFTREDIEHLQFLVARRLLRIPPEFVTISGIEPSDSLIITLMVPEEFAPEMLNLTGGGKILLKQICVSYINIDGEEIQITVNHTTIDEESNRVENETRNYLHKLKRREEELETCQLQLLELRKKLDGMKYRLAQNKAHEASKVEESETNKSPTSTLQYRSALVIFRDALGKVRKKKYDSDLISYLLDAQSLLTQARYKDANYEREKRHFDTAEKMMKDNVVLQYERDKLAYYHGLGQKDRIMSQREEYFLFRNVPKEITVTSVIQLPIDSHCLEAALKRLATRIDEKELKNALESMSISKAEKKRIGKSSYKLLQMLILPNPEQGVRLTDDYIQKKLEVFKRPELAGYLTTYINEYMQQKQREHRQQEEQQQQQSYRKQQRHQYQQHGSSSHQTSSGISQSKESIAEDDGKIDKILDYVKAVDERTRGLEMQIKLGLYGSPGSVTGPMNENIFQKFKYPSY